jgi:mersacidin/lichenicidin family type 2 lantibiotic
MKGYIHMKFDIARAWKDESYRQTLSEEQLSMLPANPAGEMSEAELASVCGGWGGFGFGASSASSASAIRDEHRTHSFALLCDVSLFSLNVIQIPIVPIASPFTQCCGEDH